MENFIEVIQSVILPIVTIVLGYFGWRANADKNKLKVELKSLEHSNTAKEIENQSSWIDLYEKLANSQAKRMASMEEELQQVKKNLNKFENAFKKAHGCNYFDVCPIRYELSKFENTNRKGTARKPRTNRQRERPDGESDKGNSDSSGDSDNETES